MPQPDSTPPFLRPPALAVAGAVVLGVVVWIGVRPRDVTLPAPAVVAAQNVAPATVAPAVVAPATVAPATIASAQVATAPVAPVTAAPVPAATPPAALPAAQAAPQPAPASGPASAPAAAEMGKPSFDIVRVAPSGDAVLAGRAAPGAEVTVATNGHEIGRTQADAQGSWVMVPAAPLAAGGQELAVASRTPEGQQAKGDSPVLVLLPERRPPAPGSAPPQTAAPSQTAALSQAVSPPQVPAPAAVAVLMPPNAVPRVLQAAPAAGPASSALGLQVVDYDNRGQIRFGGAAPPGATVRLYIDDAPVGDAVTDALGRWTMLPDAAVDVGDHRLRIDEVGAAGKVSARVELPFQRASVSPQDVAEGRLIVQPRQNLWRIARHAYGQGVRYTTIYEANRDQIRDPNLIYPGQIFAIPAAAR